MTAKELRDKLAPLQEKQGYLFNADETYTMPLLESLLVNKERYGYMACPCRLASGVYEKDKDVICPCVYRAPDVEEYGACFCALYVSKEYQDGGIERKTVPERRPPEKLLEALEASMGS
ncbi:ferredoxin thioredoxin reductase beta chain [Desulfovibrio sp. X2]|uniref:ferredoxin-thioredoxin reductase catalytic domain-containing protein n=1 Tax=Desulfovibrio sp. X2 TaxID=941449 RepID=UPI000358A4AD|nr:ferredoxin-thioredoxin reductase catalytic domain-containing protein [Desulfovibrio sp. X2]EPR44796.1 ferredoxin thioredoxin reductase beta chain [Desulfovibrio sp. X2]